MHGNLPDYIRDFVSVYNPKRCRLRSGNSSIKKLCRLQSRHVLLNMYIMCYSLAHLLNGTHTREHSVS